MPWVTVRHILVKTEEDCLELKRRIAEGADFAELAKERSQCPSGARGGEFSEQYRRGELIPELDQAAFSGEVGELLGPIESQYGYHLLEVTSRETK